MISLPIPVIALILISLTANANPALRSGSLDPEFGNGGKVLTAFSARVNAISKILLQPDGKILAAGRTHTVEGKIDWLVARYEKNGALDKTFGDGGKKVIPLGYRKGRASNLALQPDGKILVTGWTKKNNNDIGLARLNPDGSLDDSFGTGGIVLTPVGQNHDYAREVKALPDGKILVVGSYVYRYQNHIKYYNIVLLRYDSGGTLDPSFGNGGIQANYLGVGHNTKAFASALDEQNKIVIVGRTNDLSIKPWHYFAIATRHLPSGPIDPKFNPKGLHKTGVASFELGPGRDEAWAVTIQKDGKIILGGGAHNGNNQDFVLLRLDPTGALDPAFGEDGITIVPTGTGEDCFRDLALAEDGKILTAGYSNSGTKENFTVARFLEDGRLDIEFSPDSPTPGMRFIDFGSAVDRAYGIQLQSDGKIVVGGESTQGTMGSFALARVLP